MFPLILVNSNFYLFFFVQLLLIWLLYTIVIIVIMKDKYDIFPTIFWLDYYSTLSITFFSFDSQFIILMCDLSNYNNCKFFVISNLLIMKELMNLNDLIYNYYYIVILLCFCNSNTFCARFFMFYWYYVYIHSVNQF